MIQTNEDLFTGASRKLGCCKVWIRDLKYEEPLEECRQLDQKNLSRLKGIFETEGCHQSCPRYRVPALIDDETFKRVSRDSDLAEDALPLRLERSITYLHGRHRLEAARTHLDIFDRWWTVDLYSTRLSTKAKSALQHDYSNTSNFSDGDIYRCWRRCAMNNDAPGQLKWLARLSESKRRDVKQLSKFKELESFREALDELLPFPGLWSALQIGSLRRVLTLRCPEELTSYIVQVRLIWQWICNDDHGIHAAVDPETVRRLEGKCPVYSREDCKTIEDQIDRHEIFPAIPHRDRSEIVARLRRIDRPIPSIFTFLEDAKYLEPCAKIMKALLPTGFKDSIKAAYMRHHDRRSEWVEQMSEDESVPRNEASSATACQKAYQQLWLYAIRHFPEMTGQTPRKDPGRPKPQSPAIERSWWFQMSKLAADSGFVDMGGTTMDSESVDAKMARDFLRQARPDLLYEFDAGVFDSEVRRICDILSRCKRRRLEPETPRMSSDRTSCGTDIIYRCGRPFESSFLDDRQFFFLRHMNCSNHEGQKRFLTSFAVSRGMFNNFFKGTTAHDHTSEMSPDVSSGLSPADIDSRRRYSVPLSVNTASVGPLLEAKESASPAEQSLTVLRWSPSHPTEFESRRFGWMDRSAIRSSVDGFHLVTCEGMKFVSSTDVVANRAGSRFIKTKESSVAQLREYYEKHYRK